MLMMMIKNFNRFLFLFYLEQLYNSIIIVHFIFIFQKNNYIFLVLKTSFAYIFSKNYIYTFRFYASKGNFSSP